MEEALDFFLRLGGDGAVVSEHRRDQDSESDAPQHVIQREGSARRQTLERLARPAHRQFIVVLERFSAEQRRDQPMTRGVFLAFQDDQGTPAEKGVQRRNADAAVEVFVMRDLGGQSRVAGHQHVAEHRQADAEGQAATR